MFQKIGGILLKRIGSTISPLKEKEMFYSKSYINILKQLPIVNYLQTIGKEPHTTIQHQLVYFSPLTEEKTPSFFVEPKKNVFHDFASGQKGDIIRLIRLIEQIPFFDAVSRLEGLKSGNLVSSFSFSGAKSLTKESKIQIVRVKPVTHLALIRYIEQRGISIDLANLYLKEVHFINQDKAYFALGFANNGGGYELRNPLDYKGKTANGITVFDKQTDTVNLFEGFFDFLSALQYYNTTSFKNTTIVLNTTNNLTLSYDYLNAKSIINSFLDNDKGGQNAVNQLLNKQYQVINQSELLYPNSKDFNDYLLGKRKSSV